MLGSNRKTSVKCSKRTGVCSSKKVIWSIAHLKCLYTNACSMGNEQEELETTVHLESCDLIADTETWWDESHDWSAAINGHKLSRRHRQGRRGGQVALYVKNGLIAESCL